MRLEDIDQEIINKSLNKVTVEKELISQFNTLKNNILSNNFYN